MSTLWDAANPTAANGVTDKMIEDAEKRARDAKAKPVTIADIEAEMKAVAAGKGSPSYNLMSAATADQLRNLISLIEGNKKLSNTRYGATAEVGNFAAVAAQVTSTVPNPSAALMNAVGVCYLHKIEKNVGTNVALYEGVTKYSNILS